MRFVRLIVVGTSMFVSAVTWPAAVVGQDFELTIENIMRGPELIGRSPQALRGGGFGASAFDWSPDSRYVYFRWQQPGVDTALAPYRVAADGGDPERLTDRAADSVLVGNGVWSRDRRRAVFVVKGDLVLWAGDESRWLTNTFEGENNPHWSADGREVFFRRGSNLFALHVDRGELRQLTDIRSGNGPRERARPTSARSSPSRRGSASRSSATAPIESSRGFVSRRPTVRDPSRIISEKMGLSRVSSRPPTGDMS